MGKVFLKNYLWTFGLLSIIVECKVHRTVNLCKTIMTPVPRRDQLLFMRARAHRDYRRTQKIFNRECFPKRNADVYWLYAEEFSTRNTPRPIVTSPIKTVTIDDLSAEVPLVSFGFMKMHGNVVIGLQLIPWNVFQLKPMKIW